MNPDFQKASEIIHLSKGWSRWDGELVYQEGARSKYSVFCDAGVFPEFIRHQWRYLFKLPRSRYPWQFWMEVVAYRIGCAIGVAVPPSHVAIGFGGQPGSLTEWMFDSRDKSQGLELGGEFMLRQDREYDRAKGMSPGHCHNLDYMDLYLRGGQSPSFFRMFLLDTLIANTDRHHSNWGLLTHVLATDGQSSFRELRPAPAFDNGTSLGHERLEDNLSAILADQDWFKRHATRADARHHIRLHPEDEKGTPMLELVPEMIRRYPDMLPTVKACAAFGDEDIRQAVFPLCEFDMPVRLTENRAEFICRMVCTRRDMLMERLEHYAQA